MVFGLTSLWKSEWWYRHMGWEICSITSLWWLSFNRVRMPVMYLMGTSQEACLTKTAWAADSWSACSVVPVTKHGMKCVNTCHMDSRLWDVIICNYHIQNFIHFLVAVLKHCVNIDWVAVLGKNSAKELILANVPWIFVALQWHPPYCFACGLYCWVTYSAFASRWFLSLRGCPKSKPMTECCSYLLSIVLLVLWSIVMG